MRLDHTSHTEITINKHKFGSTNYEGTLWWGFYESINTLGYMTQKKIRHEKC